MATKITIADLFPDDEGMILVAKDEGNRLPRHISDVANGAACGCACFGCGRRLIARNGGSPTLRAHSFAHRPEDMVRDCLSSGETILHIRAKEIIAKHRRITLPEAFTLGLDGKPVIVNPERSIDLTDICLETAEGEVIPDIIATMPDGRRLFIEIANTHPCPREKIEKLDALGVDVLEIDVSRYRNHPLDELDEIILDIARRKLIHSADVKAMAAKIAEEKRRQEEAKLLEAKRLVAIYRDPDIRNHRKAQALVERMILLGLSEFLDLNDERPSAFIVYRRQWQAAVLYRLSRATPSEAISAMSVIESFSKRQWAKKGIAYTKSGHSRWIAANVAEDFRSPYEEVLAYLKRLEKVGAALQMPDLRFIVSYDLSKRIAAAEERLALPEKQKAELFTAYQGIGALMLPEDGALPDFETWLAARATSLGMSIDELVGDEDGGFDELLDQVDAVENMILDMQKLRDVEPPDEMADLPMGRLINRLGLARLAAEDKAEAEFAARQQRVAAETTARLKRERDERIDEIENAANLRLGYSHVWLATPLPEHGGKTPVELAAESPEGLGKANAILREIWDARRAAQRADDLRKTMVGRLYDRVHERNLRRDMADLWLTQPCKQLGGARPVDYCVDEKALARCIEVLDEFVISARRKKHR